MLSSHTAAHVTALPRSAHRAMGPKLLLVSVLALLMSLPALLIAGLTEDRRLDAQAHQVSGQEAPRLLGVLPVVNPYRSVERSLKYAPLFLGLVFLAYFVFEARGTRRVHPAQYVLVGTAQTIFYLLLLSLAERIGFDLAFLLAGGATVALLSANGGWVFETQQHTRRAALVFGPLYLLIYLLLRLENNALLLGSAASFCALAAAMYLTRGLDWYGVIADGAFQSAEPPPLVPGPEH